MEKSQMAKHVSVDKLGAALDNLALGAEIFITYDDYAAMFSPGGEHPNEFDDEGKQAVAQFAATSHCTPRNVPAKSASIFPRTQIRTPAPPT
jgi:hypothetical protein